ncbi:MAG: carbohydrate-binding protein [Ignavibacteriaceae bacterium]|nr:carbohydrate-binding protein [Ignavibacteriaceae bacterium]
MKRLTNIYVAILFILMQLHLLGQVHLTESFDSGNSIPTSSSNAPSTPTTYTTSSGVWTLFKAYRHGTTNFSAPYALRLLKNTNEAPSYAVTPTINSAGTLSFQAYGSSSKPIVVYKSTDNGSTWILVDTVFTGSGAFQYCSVTINDGSVNMKLKIENGTGSVNDLNIDDVEITSYSAAPTIQLSTYSLNSFGTVIAGENSQIDSYSLSAYNLTSNITVKAPNQYKVSLDNSTFLDSVIVQQSGGLVSLTQVYVRFSPPSAIGTVIDNIQHFSTGASTQNVSLSGIAIASEPTQQSSLSFGEVTGSSIVINFSVGNGAKRLLVAREGSAVNWVPLDGVIVTGVDNNFSTASTQGSGNKAVYSGNGNSVTVTGLVGNTTYHFALYEYNEGTNNSQNYNVTIPNTGNQTTLSQPTLIVNPQTLSFGNVQVSTTSEVKSYVLSGHTLSPAVGNINITAPDGFQISLSQSSQFASVLQIPYSGEVLAQTTVYVRFSPTITSLYNGSVSHSGGNASTVNVVVSGVGTSPAEPNVFQAEDGVFVGAYVSQKYSGYTGWGYADITDRTGSFLEFAFRKNTASTETVTITYSNGGSSRSYQVKLNDNVLGTLNFPTTGSWTTWSTVTYNVTFVSGINRLSFNSTTNNTNANIDKISLTGETAVPVYKLTLLKSGAGTVTASPMQAYYDAGTQVTLTATPSAANVFYRWNGTEVSYSNPTSIVMNSHKTQVALMNDYSGYANFPYEANPRGFASLPGRGYSTGTTGGSGIGNNVIYVSTAQQLMDAMYQRIDANGVSNYAPLIVYVVGILSRDAGIGEMVDVKDVYDVSIIGVGSDATITGFGLNVTRSKNIIIRNIKFASWSDDAISVDGDDDPNKGNHVWVDHCTFTYTPPPGYPTASGPDGSVDITHAVDLSTVSFCLFDNTDKNSLVGHSNSNVADTAMKLTYHHNWFKNSVQRNPRVRFAKVHVYNNYYTNNSIYGVSSNMEADVLVEGNYFFNTPIPTETSRDGSPPGDLVERYNIFDNTGPAGTRGDAFEASQYYSYSLDPASEIPNKVSVLAGSGLFDFSNPDVIIPVELNKLNISSKENIVTIEWSTSSEVNNTGWEIEVKNQNGVFIPLGFVDGKGNSTILNYYSFTDNSEKISGLYQYRLKQINFDGSYTYSEVVSVDINRVLTYLLNQNYPNPFNPATTISYQIPVKQHVSLVIYDVLGNQVKEVVNEVKEAGTHLETFNMVDVATGVYIYRLKSGQIILSQKMLLLK